MRVRVVGSSASVPRPGRACSCHLVTTARTSIVMDIGTGALANLRKAVDVPSLDGVLVSHMHADHFLDLIPLRYGLKYGPFSRPGRLPLWLPPGGERTLRALTASFAREGPSDFLDDAFDVREYDPGSDLRIGDLSVTFARTVHYIDAYAMRVHAGGKSVAFSSDSAPCDALTAIARDADVFLCECSLGTTPEAGPERGHLTATEAGEAAAAAAARGLLLVHYGSETDADALHAAASAAFSGRCAVADDGTEVRL